MAITAEMAILDIMDVRVCIALIAAMSTFSLEALAAALPEPNCRDLTVVTKGAVMAPMAIMAVMAVMAIMVVMVVTALMATLTVIATISLEDLVALLTSMTLI